MCWYVSLGMQSGATEIIACESQARCDEIVAVAAKKRTKVAIPVIQPNGGVSDLVRFRPDLTGAHVLIDPGRVERVRIWEEKTAAKPDATAAATPAAEATAK